ncbi:ribokinase [Phytohabitans sp. ZYX-F-186]|uniref:Ribokinase n=1 Tax=Phytohabitans maris TaxID=3071409 RepID=A0ABU0ZVS0_9ACTN|nr:ribokinase [Phytohabitans sp. ZYX-F-186]MDQ7911129.1 ribokinase [Phytohabitans sp. ZYX-F-186]
MSSPRAGHVVVVGSVNLDISVKVHRLPHPGETVLATSVHRTGGGKGANQAVAAARAGGTATSLIGRVGNDEEGRIMRSLLRHDRLDLRLTTLTDATSGLALVTVDDHAENSIVVAPGANASPVPLSHEDAQVVAQADVLLCQLETPPQLALDAAGHRRPGVPLLLNAAPAMPLPEALWNSIDMLIVNQHEATELTQDTTGTLDHRIAQLLQRTPTVLVTLGKQGSLLATRDQPWLHLPAPAVNAVDTTAAGDTFCGVLAAELANGVTTPNAVATANAAAALAVTRPGAQSSIPDYPEVTAAALGLLSGWTGEDGVRVYDDEPGDSAEPAVDVV